MNSLTLFFKFINLYIIMTASQPPSSRMYDGHMQAKFATVLHTETYII